MLPPKCNAGVFGLISFSTYLNQNFSLHCRNSDNREADTVCCRWLMISFSLRAGAGAAVGSAIMSWLAPGCATEGGGHCPFCQSFRAVLRSFAKPAFCPYDGPQLRRAVERYFPHRSCPACCR